MAISICLPASFGSTAGYNRVSDIFDLPGIWRREVERLIAEGELPPTADKCLAPFHPISFKELRPNPEVLPLWYQVDSTWNATQFLYRGRLYDLEGLKEVETLDEGSKEDIEKPLGIKDDIDNIVLLLTSEKAKVPEAVLRHALKLKAEYINWMVRLENDPLGIQPVNPTKYVEGHIGGTV